MLSRIFLLLTIVLPIVLPFISLPALSQQLQTATVSGVQLPEFVVDNNARAEVIKAGDIALYIYVAGALLSLAVTVLHLYKLYSVISKSAAEKRDGYILLKDTKVGPGSWYKYILLPDAEENETVIEHELAHIQLRHTLDIVFINLVQVVFWPNLLLLWIKKELVQVHEFQADAKVSLEKQAYAQMLVSSVLGTCTIAEMHSFIIHPIKRRIMMLKKHGRRLPRLITFAATVLFTGILLVNIIGIQSCKSKNWDVKETEVGTSKDFGTVKFTEILDHAEKMPEFPGGNNAFIKYMSENVKYPKEAMEKGIEGKVLVEFVVQEDGKVDFPEVKKSPNPILSEAALNTIRNMPNWIPAEDKGKKVAVNMVLPVSFKL
jgi:TonB family protein